MTGWRSAVSTGCNCAGGVSLIAITLLSVADVISRSALNRPIRGTLEIVELLLTCTFFLALPAIFLREENIVVDIVDGIAPRWVSALRRLASALGVLVLASMAWQGWVSATDALRFQDVTSDLSIPMIWYWTPVLIGMISGAIAAFVTLLHPTAVR